MIKTSLTRMQFDLVGEQCVAGQLNYVDIGDAQAFRETTSDLSDKTTFVVVIRRPPIYFSRTFLVPRVPLLSESLFMTFRLCDSSLGVDRDFSEKDFVYGIGKLVPSRGLFPDKNFYYQLVADEGQGIWECGRFLGHLDPHQLPDFFTISDPRQDEAFDTQVGGTVSLLEKFEVAAA